jgi:2,4-dienoyl-CoA reductase-like NADH-dependent reductase (Old Yellow Enzyme family)
VALAREFIADASWPYRAARELGLERPAEVLPPSYAFYLNRRAAAQR